MLGVSGGFWRPALSCAVTLIGRMSLFSSAFRYALVLAISLGLLHFGGASARAGTCGGGEADGFSLSASFSGATPMAVGTIPDKKIAAGASFVRFSARFNAGNLPSDVYLYRIQAGDFQDTGRMLLLK